MYCDVLAGGMCSIATWKSYHWMAGDAGGVRWVSGENILNKTDPSYWMKDLGNKVGSRYGLRNLTMAAENHCQAACELFDGPGKREFFRTLR